MRVPLGGTVFAQVKSREFVSSLAGAPPSLPFCLHASFHHLLTGRVALEEEESNAPPQVTASKSLLPNEPQTHSILLTSLTALRLQLQVPSTRAAAILLRK